MSPLAKLFAKIKAEMVANGTPFADSAAEAAFRTWLQAAWLDSGCTQEFAVLYQPATSTTVSTAVRGSADHKANVWWGDGTTSSYALNSESNTSVSKAYAVGALRPIVMLGKLTRVECVGQAFGGRLWANLRSLTYLDCGGCSLLTGDIAALPQSLTYLDCGDCSLLTGDISALPQSLRGLYCGGCSLLTGDIAAMPQSLTYLYCGGCSLLTGNIAALPQSLTLLYCGGCSPTYSTVSGTRVWATGLRGVWIAVTTVGLWTSAMTDALLIDLSGTTFLGEKQVQIGGNCASPTSAAADAIDSLIEQGVSVNTN